MFDYTFNTDAMEFLQVMTYYNIDVMMSRMKDDEMIKWTIQFLAIREEAPVIQLDVKSAEIAKNYIDQGNQNFHTSGKSLELYTLGVIHAPPDSKQLALAYGNRSAVLYNEGFYGNSILDIGRALSIGYPDEMVAKLYVRKARCLYALNNDKMSSEVEEAVADARRLLEKMKDEKKKYMNDMLNKLTMKSSKKTLFKEVDYRKFFPHTPADNPSIVGASGAVEIKYSKNFGNHLVATKDIQAGELLFMHEAFASTVEPDYLMDYCWNCSKRIWAGVPCRECHTVIYCSEICRDRAWRDYHDIECRIIPTLIYMKKTSFDLLVFKMTAKALKEAGSGEKLKKMVSEIDNTKDPITKCYSGESFDASKYASVYTTTSSDIKPHKFAMASVVMVYFLASTTKMCGEKISNLRDLLDSQLAIFIGILMIKHFTICSAMCRQLIGYKSSGGKFRYGRSLNPFLDLMHHSCDPMVWGVSAGDIRAVVTLQNIKKGEQIFASTGPAFWKRSVEERQSLMPKSRSKCSCKPCLQNFGPTTVCSLPHVQDSIPVDITELFAHILFNDFHFFSLRVPIEKLPSFLSRLSTLMDKQDVPEYPTQGAVVLKHLTMTLYDRVSLMLNGN